MVRSRHLIAILCLAAAGACSDPKPTTGSLIVTIDGLPAGAESGVTVAGPAGYFKRSLGTA